MMIKRFIISLLCVFVSHFVSAQTYIFQNKSIDTETRIENLLSLMTIDEKIQCLGTNPSVSRLGLKATGHVEGLHGLAMGEPGNWGGDNPVPTTTFPQAYGMGHTWDVMALKQMGEIEGYDVRYLYQSPKYKRGGLVVRAPNADLSHDPRWGRTEECYGEDPFLVASLSVAFIKGLQGDDPDYWMAASLMKHFLANSNEDTRTTSSSDFDERLMHEYYAYPFMKGVIEGGSRAYMAAYNKVNQVPMMVSPLLNELTVKQWGQDGIICTDGGALRLLIEHHKYYETLEMGAAMGIKSGINQFLDNYDEAVKKALAKGLITEADIDKVLKGVFRVMLKLGCLDNTEPYATIGLRAESEPWLSARNKQVVREATQKSIVLLKNENETLPVNAKKVKKIAIVGWLANDVLCDWYSGTPPYKVTPLQGIKDKFGDDIEIVFASDSTFDKALAIAKNADLVLAFGGNHPTGNAGWEKVTRDSYGKEAVDRQSINLEDEAWIKKLYEVNQNTVLVLVSSFPYAINWSNHNLPAVVHITHNSQEMGNALADVLAGDYNPAGRLTQDWPMAESNLPSLLDYNIRNGHTYLYGRYPVLYPFGHGLSYTQFEYSDADISIDDEVITFKAQVKNTGKMDGDEVVQVYVSFPDSKIERPSMALKGFIRTHIKRNESKEVIIPIKLSDLNYWDIDEKKWVLEKGLAKILAGSSSSAIHLVKEIEIE